MDERRAAAYRKLDEATRELAKISRAEDDDGDPTQYVPTDYVLIVGLQGIDEDGDRVGYVTMFPKDGCQPRYITTGILAQINDTLRAPRVVE
ncbi:Uncharacterised protein [Mycobacteroides abscessus subsp. bolletii]|uniref:Uncharacterized protein n=1 Tax=Mycobacteroides abscessus subsp. bolletii TaxID=319705 RepID=A0A9Q7SE63_9MYCO|nr:hypothetical protein [Mycobacteroides abscessus]SHT85650.1 Uncharacterised protein [Mycobacteroides abscessus subsp. bolletii]SHU02248.1 Uncharacterised protein [Mycobacteroides abscessus subsp. bolletii]SHX43035.1 Uncharacterised protein [Mycobacteroides abscessus subsp. bolletii]SKM64676.1 Uncharacterised protein [Mycobacteroides abscessus subsp. bolletii]SKN38903.1 Uncharacterised protein [Mycobacteroides abscessus subsp. bolletii]